MDSIDLNADLGEADNADWAKSEREMLRYITSANIACGGHAGTPNSMRHMIRGAIENNVVIGAHPAFPDKVHFGRKSMKLDKDITAEDLKASLTKQIITLAKIAEEEGTCITYVKPHGALYNDAIKDTKKAELIADVIKHIDPKLIFMGGPNSEMGKAAKRYNLTFIAEGFIDRRYTDDGHLQSRAIDGAVIKDQAPRLVQARRLVTLQSVITASGKELPIEVKTLCLHGDSAGAVETARLARIEIESAGIKIKAFANA